MCLSVAIHRPDDVLGSGYHKGFQWIVTHNPMRFRCGYVRIPEGHPWHGKTDEDIYPDVHGGLTFAEPDEACDAPGEDKAWWLGFDCGHHMDNPDPTLPGKYTWNDTDASGTIRTQEYVEAQCKSLCQQAKEADV
jgi:hypothetical protein